MLFVFVTGIDENERTARNFFRSRPRAISLTREKALLITHLTSSAILTARLSGILTSGT